MSSNKHDRKVETVISTITYWVVLLALLAGSVACFVILIDAGSTWRGLAAMAGSGLFLATAISYGVTMQYRKRAPSR